MPVVGLASAAQFPIVMSVPHSSTVRASPRFFFGSPFFFFLSVAPDWPEWARGLSHSPDVLKPFGVMVRILGLGVRLRNQQSPISTVATITPPSVIMISGDVSLAAETSAARPSMLAPSRRGFNGMTGGNKGGGPDGLGEGGKRGGSAGGDGADGAVDVVAMGAVDARVARAVREAVEGKAGAAPVALADVWVACRSRRP